MLREVNKIRFIKVDSQPFLIYGDRKFAYNYEKEYEKL